MMSNRRALVTGGSSFLASHLIPALLRGGWQVRACGRRSRPDHVPQEVEYRSIDLAGGRSLDPLLDGISHVLHVAGASSSYSTEDEMQRANVVVTERLVEAAVDRPLDRFVYISSSAVYGEEKPLPQPVREEATPQPSRGYGKTKWEAEQAVWAGVRDGLPGALLRPVTVYGPRNTKLVASAILDASIERYAGMPALSVAVDPVELRLVHADDATAASLLLLTDDRAAGRAFNLSSGVYPTSHEVAAAIASTFGLRVELDVAADRGLAAEARPEVRERMVAAGMRPEILLTERRLHFLGRANRNNRLSLEALAGLGFQPRVTDLVGSIAATVRWYREARWVL